MIVCSCNVLSDEQVRTVARIVKRRAASSVYVCLRCRVRCGRCTRTIREIMDKELDQPKCQSARNIDP
jgi:bacterioferritin-associated ferredoxin